MIDDYRFGSRVTSFRLRGTLDGATCEPAFTGLPQFLSAKQDAPNEIPKIEKFVKV